MAFIAVVPVNTAAREIAAIKFYGGRLEKVDDVADLESRCKALAAQLDRIH